MTKQDEKDKRKWTSVAVPEDLVEKCREEARARDVSVAWLVRRALEEYFSKKH